MNYWFNFRKRVQAHPAQTAVMTVLVIAVVSLFSNISRPGELSGQENFTWFLRLTVSELVNSGTVWAGIGFWVGWLFARPLRAVVAAILAAEATLVVHYALGQLLGVYTVEIWGQNLNWFILAVVGIAPLALLGALARSQNFWGFLASFTLPLGALAEPWVTGLMHSSSAAGPWPLRWGPLLAGGVLIIAGVAGIVYCMIRAAKNPALLVKEGRGTRKENLSD